MYSVTYNDVIYVCAKSSEQIKMRKYEKEVIQDHRVQLYSL